MNHHDDPKRALHKAIWLPCLIFSFSFWSASFFAFSCSILFIILKFSSLVIQKLWNIFFLIVCFLMKVGTSIKSSKEKLLPILKNLFIYRSRLCTSSLFFFTLLIFILFPFHYYSFSTFHHALNQQLSYFRTKVL